MPANPDRVYEFRCPVHGFVQLNPWEREIVNHPAFQRLKRIRQLALTDCIYPGAMHTRFEHSLGVMHIATRLFDSIRQRCGTILTDHLEYTNTAWERHRQLVRLAALLHDVGHGPFSHAGEDLMPCKDGGKHQYTHEEYSAAIIRSVLREVIEEHQFNLSNHEITADRIASLLEGKSGAAGTLFWRDLITGQLDADRMDYLLRDALHTGVSSGGYDLDRLIGTVVAIPRDDRAPQLGINLGGVHAAESLVLARYFMFTQVYFHKTRIAYDRHLQKALSAMLPDGKFPRPTKEDGTVDVDGVNEYLEWDDWRVMGNLKNNKGGEHGRMILERNHFREVFHTIESPGPEELEVCGKVKKALGELLEHEATAGKTWYKFKKDDVTVLDESQGSVRPLSKHSALVASLKPIAQIRLYVTKANQDEGKRRRIEALQGGLGV